MSQRTALGAAATAHFGKEALLSIPVERALDLGDAGVLLQTDARPPPGPLPGPRERAVIDALGREYVFDIAAPTQPRAAIPGLRG
ncbi:MAG: hypothetical protein JNL21_35665 [Myxococcales bacterium]|nr:hypothetical protein [Myxococcales bacterium]